MRKLRNRKCLWCRNWFDSHVRLGDRQKSCGNGECKKKQKRFSHRCWQKREQEDYRKGLSDWRKAHPNYWKKYRKRNPEYTRRNRLQSRIRKQLLKLGLQKRIDILEVTEKQMKYWHLPRFAKQTRSLAPLLFAYSGPHEFALHPAQPQAP